MDTAMSAVRVLARFDRRMASTLESKLPKKQLEDLKRQRENIAKGEMYYGSHYDAAESASWYLKHVPGWTFTQDTQEVASRYDPGRIYNVKVLVIEAPNHKTFRAVDDSGTRDSQVAEWLRDETNYIDALDAKIVEITSTLRAEAHKKKQGRPVPQGQGTCPCCFGAYKLRRSQGTILMVIHGYERPGVGYIEGRCHGHDFPPFQISKDGTESFVKVLEKTVQTDQERLKKYKQELTIPRDKITVVELNRKIVPKPDGGFQITQDTYTPEHPKWEKALESRETQLRNDIDSTERRIEALKRDIKDLKGRIAKWKPVEGFVEALG